MGGKKIINIIEGLAKIACPKNAIIKALNNLFSTLLCFAISKNLK